MTDHQARVYDLDGTLVRLAVDWGQVREDLASIYREAGIEVGEDAGIWDLMVRADGHGLRDAVEGEIERHEREGATGSDRLAAADDIVGLSMPVAVCSLNAEAACRIALERHGLGEHVEAVVGRDSIPAHKPDPEPLLAAIRAIGADPAETLFIGDTETDERTAERAGVPFVYVEEFSP